jgi:HD-GYP domain-containing protein (c-di-GMP phosphodiesterase class II)
MNWQIQKLRKIVLISVTDVRMGMFIAELDRPWAGTPFEMQGFLLTESSQMAILQDLVKDLKIDPSRSATHALDHLPWDVLHEPLPDLAFAALSPARKRPGAGKSAHGMHLKQPAPYYLRYDGSPQGRQPSNLVPARTETERRADHVSELTPPSSQRFSQFIESMYPRDTVFAPLDLKERLQSWWHSRKKPVALASLERQVAPLKRLVQQRPDYLPPSIGLVTYADVTTNTTRNPQVEKVVQKADQLLARIASDIRSDQSIDLQDVNVVVEVLVDSVISNPSALMWSARMRDQNKKTYTHGLKVAIYLMALGRHLGFPRQQLSELGNIGLLLDIGMLTLPPELLEKATHLTQAENALLNGHVDSGLAMLQETGPIPHNVALGIRQHHERLDGSGYPERLKGEAISIYGKMAAIADSFAAMTTARPYDITHSAFDALKELFKEAGGKLHAPLVEQFVQAISIFPVGSLIELSSGEVAIVLEHNRIRRLEPKVLILTSPEKEPLEKPVMIDLMKENSLAHPDCDAAAIRERMKILRGLPDGAYDIGYSDYYLP